MDMVRYDGKALMDQKTEERPYKAAMGMHKKLALLLSGKALHSTPITSCFSLLL